MPQIELNVNPEYSFKQAYKAYPVHQNERRSQFILFENMEHLQPKFELDQSYFLSLVNTKP